MASTPTDPHPVRDRSDGSPLSLCPMRGPLQRGTLDSLLIWPSKPEWTTQHIMTTSPLLPKSQKENTWHVTKLTRLHMSRGTLLFFLFIQPIFAPRPHQPWQECLRSRGTFGEKYKKNRESWAEREKWEMEEWDGEQLCGLTGRSADD